MEQRYVGSSGLRVSLLALGTLAWGDETDAASAGDLLQAFVAAGGTTVDVTAGIGAGAAVLGGVLGRRVSRSDVVLVARAGRWGSMASFTDDLSRRGLLQALDATLTDLGTDHVDVWLAHGWSDDVPLDETLSALRYAQDTGRTRYVGVSEHRGWHVARAATAHPGLVAASAEWSLVARGAEAELVPACASLGVGVLATSPLGRGVLTGKYRTGVARETRASGARQSRHIAPYLTSRSRSIVDALATAADGLAMTPAQVALAWLAGHDEVASAVVGPRNADQLAGLLDAPMVLPEEIGSVLDEVSAPLA